MTAPIQARLVAKPAAVKWILGLVWLRLVVYALSVLLAIAFVSPAESEWLQGFREGWIRATGHAPSEYGYEQAGEVMGAGFIPAILGVLILVFIGQRKLTALRVVAVVNLVFSLAQPASLLLTLPALILTFVKSTKQYCRGGAPPEAPAAA